MPITFYRKRLLVVEDEFLVALPLLDHLEEIGAVVIGPFATVSEALAQARLGDYDAAILDVNVGGSAIWPVAQLLAEQGKPFVFVTGYVDGESFPPTLRHIDRVGKPARPERVLAALAARMPDDGGAPPAARGSDARD